MNGRVYGGAGTPTCVSVASPTALRKEGTVARCTPCGDSPGISAAIGESMEFCKFARLFSIVTQQLYKRPIFQVQLIFPCFKSPAEHTKIHHFLKKQAQLSCA